MSGGPLPRRRADWKSPARRDTSGTRQSAEPGGYFQPRVTEIHLSRRLAASATPRPSPSPTAEPPSPVSFQPLKDTLGTPPLWALVALPEPATVFLLGTTSRGQELAVAFRAGAGRTGPGWAAPAGRPVLPLGTHGPALGVRLITLVTLSTALEGHRQRSQKPRTWCLGGHLGRTRSLQRTGSLLCSERPALLARWRLQGRPLASGGSASAGDDSRVHRRQAVMHIRPLGCLEGI